MSAVYRAGFLLDCCPKPNHSIRFIDNGVDSSGTDESSKLLASHEWYCKTCGRVWTPGQYEDAQLHDEKLANSNMDLYAGLFDFGRDRV